MTPWAQERPMEEIFLAANERGIPLGYVRKPGDVLNCPQLAARDAIHEVVVPCGSLRVPRFPVHVDEWPEAEVPPLAEPARREPLTNRDGPLRGLRVLDLTWVWGGPTISQPLADLGADVYKVESAFTHQRSAAATMMAEQLNRGKLGLELDLREGADLQTFWRLVRVCDVIVESYTPGVMAKLGVTPEAVREANPRAVMVSLSAYGQSGPYVRFSGFAPSVEATSGIPSVTGYGDGVPRGAYVHHVDPLTGTIGTLATLAAVLRARRTAGSYVDVSLYEVAVASMLERFVERAVHGHEPGQLGNQDLFGGLSVVCPSDDPEIFVAVHLSARDVTRLAGVVEESAGSLEDLEAPLRAWCQSHPAERAVAELREAGIEAVVSNPIDHLVADPHVIERGALCLIPSPDGAREVLAVSQPIRFAGYEFDSSIGTPELGAHSELVLGLIK